MPPLWGLERPLSVVREQKPSSRTSGVHSAYDRWNISQVSSHELEVLQTVVAEPVFAGRIGPATIAPGVISTVVLAYDSRDGVEQIRISQEFAEEAEHRLVA